VALHKSNFRVNVEGITFTTYKIAFEGGLVEEPFNESLYHDGIKVHFHIACRNTVGQIHEGCLRVRAPQQHLPNLFQDLYITPEGPNTAYLVVKC
jgi:hypothetical protein